MTDLVARVGSGPPVTASDEGQGPALLIVHPGGQDATSWDPVAARLAGDLRVVRIRRRIYVAGADLPAAHSMSAESADIIAIAELIDAPRVLVGHSSGAVAALETALAMPSLFAGVVAYEPPMPTRDLVAGPAQRRARNAFAAGGPAEAMRIHLRDIVGIPGPVVDAMLDDPAGREAVTRFAGAQLADNDAIDGLGTGIERYRSLDRPVTLIIGATSPAHLRRRSADLAAVLPNARIVTLVGQGHIAHVDAPDALAAAIRAAALPTLSRLSRTGPRPRRRARG